MTTMGVATGHEIMSFNGTSKAFTFAGSGCIDNIANRKIS